MKSVKVFFLNALLAFVILILMSFEKNINYQGEAAKGYGVFTAWYLKNFISSLTAVINVKNMIINYMIIFILVLPLIVFIKRKLNKKNFNILLFSVIIIFMFSLFYSYLLLFHDFSTASW
ncbi:hypothetical protein DRF59_10065 [Chryseobacterium flavum]|uniref:Uncharacterized protein n=1 Tax=Chryseobacterium flavum TaxID=415851 RepID=A0A3D9CNG9_9FLAO|nr:hypothetical protein [Chryseobacterium flavum]REC67264.1 hypothetical protein DRF59_10065 [Chryseobacterium flavum]